MTFPFAQVEKIIGLNFNNKDLLRQAFIHRSYLNEEGNKTLSSNERLEFLGDAILEFWVSWAIFNRFPNYPEGLLTNFRSQVVYTQSLAQIARKLHLGQFLLLSVGEEKEGGRNNTGLLADTFESLVGAIFQDQGWMATEKFLERNVATRIETVSKKKTLKDDKSRLQELVQNQNQNIPQYRLLDSQGPDHDRFFKVGVFINNKKIAQGTGKSKQKAQQQAAANALGRLKNY
jgi:ribonuclease-3